MNYSRVFRCLHAAPNGLAQAGLRAGLTGESILLVFSLAVPIHKPEECPMSILYTKKAVFVLLFILTLIFEVTAARGEMCGIPEDRLCTQSGQREFAYSRIKNEPYAVVREAAAVIERSGNTCSVCAVKTASFLRFTDMRARGASIDEVLDIIGAISRGTQSRIDLERLAREAYRLKHDTPWDLAIIARERAMREFASCVCGG